MKSERQADLIAFCCACVGCWAAAAPAKTQAANHTGNAIPDTQRRLRFAIAVLSCVFSR
jgi:hypothetical protein